MSRITLHAVHIDKKGSIINESINNDTIGRKKDHSSGHDSIINTRDLMKKHNSFQQVVETIESCTSSEFRHGARLFDESSFISRGNNDIENLDIDIKDSNI